MAIKTKEKINEFELGGMLARIESGLINLTKNTAEIINDFKETHRDHEHRLRLQEKNAATQEDVKSVHSRITKTETTLRKVIMYIALSAGGASTVTVSLLRMFGG